MHAPERAIMRLARAMTNYFHVNSTFAPAIDPGTLARKWS
jgi:hypothetical protein